ncbi:MAG: Pr6Pr family membrane protein [Chloroflexi bacterium]|nr:Pr6Pr family membrane protein [Chloroflexota bacterium]
MSTARVLQLVRVASIVVVLAAIVAQAVELANNDRFDATRFFAFFTIQSNLIGVAAFAWLLMNGSRPRSNALELFRGAAVAYLTVTFFVVIVLLSNVDVQLQLPWVDFALHKLFPVVIALDWIIDPPAIRLTFRDAGKWLVYPLVWTGLTLVRGALDGWYPYPFLDPANGGYGQVAITAVAVTIGFFAIAAAWIYVGNTRGASVRRAP